MSDITTLMMCASGSSGEPASNAWDISKSYYDAGPNAGDVSKSSNTSQSVSINTQDATCRGLFFKPDGTKMYMVGSTSDSVHEYALSIPWKVDSATITTSFSVATEDTVPSGLFFKPDGTKMYITGLTDQDVNEYSLSTAWDISSASYVQNFSVATEETSPQDLTFKPDGTKMYVVGLTGDDVNEYSLSSAWDISTASYVQNFVLNTTNPLDITFSSDGTAMYVLHGGSFAQYSLSTAWDVSSASHVQDYSLAALGITGSNGVYLDANRSVFYILDDTNNRVYAFVIGAFSVGTEETVPNDLFFKPDGTKMYVIGQTGDDVNEYDLSSAWDISTASYLQNFSVATEEATPEGLFFKPDGTKMYVIGQSGDDVNEYSLSVAWDVSSASYVQNFSVAAQDTVPTAIFFRSDGTKMYVLGDTGNDVNEYDLSTGWDVSTASYLQTFSVASQETSPEGLSFKSDGTKMYVTGTSSDAIHQYDLSSAWDVSSASYVQSVNSFTINPNGLFFKDTGDAFFVITGSGDFVLKFTIA